MTDEKIRSMEAFISEAEGNVTHVKRVHLIAKILAVREGIAYDEDALAFAAYFHDLGYYPPYNPGVPFDHATESAKLAPPLAREWGLDGAQTEIAVEAIENHNKPGLGRFDETRLIRNADGIDYLGYMAVARDFSKNGKNMKKAMAELRKRKATFGPLVDLDAAKEIAAPRLRELDEFIARFEEESHGIY